MPLQLCSSPFDAGGGHLPNVPEGIVCAARESLELAFAIAAYEEIASLGAFTVLNYEELLQRT
jgi:hypothetical protein